MQLYKIVDGIGWKLCKEIDKMGEKASLVERYWARNGRRERETKEWEEGKQ